MRYEDANVAAAPERDDSQQGEDANVADAPERDDSQQGEDANVADAPERDDSQQGEDADVADARRDPLSSSDADDEDSTRVRPLKTPQPDKLAHRRVSSKHRSDHTDPDESQREGDQDSGANASGGQQGSGTPATGGNARHRVDRERLHYEDPMNLLHVDDLCA